jgi:hypothetical protein
MQRNDSKKRCETQLDTYQALIVDPGTPGAGLETRSREAVPFERSFEK